MVGVIWALVILSVAAGGAVFYVRRRCDSSGYPSVSTKSTRLSPPNTRCEYSEYHAFPTLTSYCGTGIARECECGSAVGAGGSSKSRESSPVRETVILFGGDLCAIWAGGWERGTLKAHNRVL